MRDYSKERSLPACPPCKRSTMQLNFDGHRLRFMDSVRSYHAVSGRRLSQGFDYSIARQRIPRQGPIPEGRYWIRPSQLWTRHFYHIYEPASIWGQHRVTIHTFPSTNTYGRGGFFIHGGGTPGSAGCIDLWNQMEAFVSEMRSLLKSETDCHIPLTVHYSTTSTR